MAHTCSRQPRQCKKGRWMGSGKRDRRLRLQQQLQLHCCSRVVLPMAGNGSGIGNHGA
jgi:hypothetical protein